MYVEHTEAVPLIWSSPMTEARPKRRRIRVPVERLPFQAGGTPPPAGGDDPVQLPRCPHCGAVPIACKQPQNCKFEDLNK